MSTNQSCFISIMIYLLICENALTLFIRPYISNKIHIFILQIISMSVAKVVAALLILTLISCDPYRTKLASQLTYISAISYETQAAIESWNCNHCSKIKVLQPKVVSNGSVYGFTGYSPDIGSIVVTFRGSVDLSNWILNLKTARTSYPLCTGCSVHIGFNQGFNSVKSQVESNLNSLLALYRTAKVVITGHSLGGALGVMAAAHIQNVYKNVDQLYTMGQPRVGNDKFAQFMTSFIPNTFRVVDYADQVPHIPQSILGFKHSGFEIWYQSGMQKYTICPSESKDCSNQLNIFQLTQSDHKMDLYLQLKVQDAFTAVRQAHIFRRVQKKIRGKIFNLDEEAKLWEDRLVNQANIRLRQELSRQMQ